ncbi:MAG TPA: response regulator [Kofleriaceae bacterium]|jgi:uncharacterized protein (TIGR02266 family)|nr:response regulator [Kofleriaceae bacterium]
MSDESSQRKHERAAVTLVVDYDGAEDFVGDYTENLSRGGTFIHTSRPFEIGSVVRLVLSFPGLLQAVAIDAVVRWARSEPDLGVGVEFLEGPGREALAALVDRIQRRDPRTVARVVRLLVVDDNTHVSSLICNGLQASAKRSIGELAFEPTTAETGMDALHRLRTETFDAVLMDVYLPVMDGHRAIEIARKELALAKLPIIAFSAGGPVARDLALHAGATMFLDKPVRLRQLVETIQQLVDAQPD